MPDRDDELRRELERLARPGDPRGAYDRVTRAMRRVRVMRRVQAAALAVAVVAGTAGAVVALERVFRSPSTLGNQPVVGPTVTLSPSPSRLESACEAPIADMRSIASGFRRIGPRVDGDIFGVGRSADVELFEDPNRPVRCRYALLIDQLGMAALVPVRGFEWLAPPSILMTTEIDGEPGLEVVLDFGGPGHPHRSGQVFTYEPGGSDGSGSVVPMELRPPQGIPILFPLGGEFAAGVDCVPEPGTIVVTVGGLAAGGDTHYDITRTTYRADGATFVEVTSESFTVPVGEQDERWPELADDPFRSCPSG